MKSFSDLYQTLDATTSTTGKVKAMAAYFWSVSSADAAWAVYFLSGRRLKRTIKATHLRQWAKEESGLPDWLFDECYTVVGDLSETIALLLSDGSGRSDLSLRTWVEEQLVLPGFLDTEGQRELVVEAWKQLDAPQTIVFNKLITGSFRVGVSQPLIIKALEEMSGIDGSVLAHRLMGHWTPDAAFFERLISPDTQDAEVSRPYPFCLAYHLNDEPTALGAPERWQIEWKWDGIRAQLIRRKGQTYLWSRGEELMNETFPEVVEAAGLLGDGTVLDGELLAWKEERVLPFGQLQWRIERKEVNRKMLQEVPVTFMAFDLLELGGLDIRREALSERRYRLEEVLSFCRATPALQLSPIIQEEKWEALMRLREQSRERLVEGFMLKDRGSPYMGGRQRGVWWKWKIDPFRIDAVLLYARRGNGKGATLYTEFTFGVWQGNELVPVARVDSELDDAETQQIDQWVRQHTVERYGPVRRVEAFLVFEIAFEGIQPSPRHKSGVALRFPRIVRWCHDKRPEDADTLDQLHALLPGRGHI